MEENVKTGYWSVATQKHLSQFQTNIPNYEEFDALNNSGKAGRLLGLIRGNTKIENMRKLEKLAGSMGIGRRELRNTILPELEKVTEKKLELKRNILDEIIGIEEYFLESEEVLSVAGDYFEYMDPDETERITIQTLSSTKKLPRSELELHIELGKNYNEEKIEKALAYQEQFRLLKKNDIKKESIYSNEYIWAGKQDKIIYALQSIDIASKDDLEVFIDALQKTQGISEKQINLNAKLIDLAKRTGIIDPVTIKTKRNFEQDFLFTSNFLGGENLVDDIMDDLKLLISAIRFGTKFTSYSRLHDPVSFLESLVKGNKVGPHSANGTDYILLESRGIVKITPSSNYPGRYYMSLIKKDVGKLALKMLKASNFDIESSVSTYDFSKDEENSILFESPESVRMKMASSPAPIAEAENYFLEVLRNERL